MKLVIGKKFCNNKYCKKKNFFNVFIANKEWERKKSTKIQFYFLPLPLTPPPLLLPPSLPLPRKKSYADHCNWIVNSVLLTGLGNKKKKKIKKKGRKNLEIISRSEDRNFDEGGCHHRNKTAEENSTALKLGNPTTTHSEEQSTFAVCLNSIFGCFSPPLLSKEPFGIKFFFFFAQTHSHLKKC